MSATSVSGLSAGVQELYDKGFFSSSVSTSTLKSLTATQLDQLATMNVATQEAAVLLGSGSSLTDSTSLSATAQSAADALTTAVSNQLTASVNAAVSQFVPKNSSSTGSIDLLG
jgi:hypothetical protein